MKSLIPALFTVGALMVLFGAAVYITGWEVAPYVYTIGATMVALAQINSPSKSSRANVKRLRRQQIFGALLLVLTGGEMPAIIVMDAISRFIPGVLGKIESAEEDSFSTGLLEYPQYTRPVNFEGLEVPEVLRSGNHALINSWRLKQSLKATLALRPDLLSAEQKELLTGKSEARS